MAVYEVTIEAKASALVQVEADSEDAARAKALANLDDLWREAEEREYVSCHDFVIPDDGVEVYL